MAQQEMPHMVLERTAEEQISPQESREKKAAPEQELTTTVSDKKKCFACKATSHTLEQCRIKEKLVTVAQLFGHSTGSPFYMIQPSEEAVEKEKFHHHCLQITSNISNLDLGKVKVELNKLWKLTNDCEIRREDRQNFLASFSSEDDLISCLKPPEMETFMDDKEVKFTIARWKEGREENLDLIREWFLVYGVPRIYRNWKKLYQVASAVGVLIEVDEESLEGGDKEPIRLRMALRNLVGAPFSDHFVFGWSSRLVTFTIEDKVQRIERQRKELEDWNGEDHLDGFNKKYEDKRNKGIEMPPETLNKGMNSELSSCTTGIVPSTGNHILDFKGCSDKEHKKEMKTTETAILLEEPKFIEELRVDGEIKENNISAPAVTTTNSKKTTEDTPKAEGVQSICGSSIGTIRGLFRDIAHEGIQKPPIKNVYGRRKNQVQKGSMEPQIASKKPNEGMNPESSSHATRIVASTGRNMLDSKSCLEKEHAKVLKMAGTALVGEGPKSIEEFGEDGKNNDNNVGASAATAINSKKQTTEDTVKAEGVQSFSGSSTCMVRGTQKKGADMTGMGQEGAEIDARQLVSKMNAQLTQNSKELSTYNEIYESFSEMGLQENLLRGIYAYGLEKPCIVHQRGIAPLCKGLDVIQQSLSGTTVTLSCGVLQRLDYGSTECQALVLVPTRDLAQETEKVVGALGHFLGVKAHACFGGHSVHEDQQILSSRVQVIVGTPGRVLDMLRRQALCPDHIRMFVLDEADEILTGGFKDQIYDIIQLLPTKIQVGVFSATMSHEALEICRKFTKKPLMIIVPRDEELQGISIKQFYVKVEREELKLDKLCDLFDTMAVTQSIIFVNSQRKVKSLTEKMRGKEYTVSASHGGMDQHARDSAVQEFRSGSSRVLIATDLRGTDVLHAPVVVNYDLPTQPVHYLRHMQRSGQPGRKGVAISFVTRADERVLSDIQRFCNSHIGKLPSNVADLL